MASYTHDDYVIGWISALPIESAAAVIMLDEEHASIPNIQGDKNCYYLGRIGPHNVVIACTNETGGVAAAIAATNLTRSFRNVQYILTVGTGGGIPSSKHQIRLGDVVVSEPTGTCPGVVHSDVGVWDENGRFTTTGSLNRPAMGLLRAIGAVKREEIHVRSMIHSLLKHHKGGVSIDGPGTEIWKYQGRENDPIYKQDAMLRQTNQDCTECRGRGQQGPEAHAPDPRIHYGIIASGVQVINNRGRRDKLGQQFGACCVETEAFGLMNYFPCLVIRGISSYADGGKNGDWKGYASLTAAAYAKELLLQLVPVEMEDTSKGDSQSDLEQSYLVTSYDTA
ncbi:hypothetical protein TWF506_000228 [Arthrobotrys conoides]|uniref:Nucleoside phosphorylase domain-containing protein n=1 Tax=Arthrobotrys conoides TaxID=74498 RepID=A0AAN8NQJ1_9PEZI